MAGSCFGGWLPSAFQPVPPTADASEGFYGTSSCPIHGLSHPGAGTHGSQTQVNR